MSGNIVATLAAFSRNGIGGWVIMFPGQRPEVTLYDGDDRFTHNKLLLSGFNEFRKLVQDSCGSRPIMLRVCTKDHDTVLMEEDELPSHVFVDDKNIKSGTYKVVLDAFIRKVEGIPLEPWVEREYADHR